MQICALRPAPIQVTYLGFQGTTGAKFFDYIITDRIVTPEKDANYFSENFVYLPHCYMVTDHAQGISDKSWEKADFELSEEGFVFCSFNNSCKIEPVMFDVWMEILHRVPNSILWLRQLEETAQMNLRRVAKDKGIEPERLVFAKRIPSKEEYLQRLSFSDLALDTRIYNGHSTTTDALWAGVPVITLKGDHFVSRASASILTAIGLSELIVDDLGEYRDLAVKLALNPVELQNIRQKLEKNRFKKPLFDTPRFVRNLESAYLEMWKIHLAGEQLRQIEVVES
jgi:predicted O-linked N-acetylglucosamine transferase (SPINDLY family)